LGNTRQFGHWIDGFLLKDRFIAEENESNTRFYSLTPNGELLLRLLKNGNVMRSITRAQREKVEEERSLRGEMADRCERSMRLNGNQN